MLYAWAMLYQTGKQFGLMVYKVRSHLEDSNFLWGWRPEFSCPRTMVYKTGGVFSFIFVITDNHCMFCLKINGSWKRTSMVKFYNMKTDSFPRVESINNWDIIDSFISGFEIKKKYKCNDIWRKNWKGTDKN